MKIKLFLLYSVVLGCFSFQAIHAAFIAELLQVTKRTAFQSMRITSSTITQPPVQRAYHLLESESLPEKVKRAYDEVPKRRFQIPHYVEDEKSKSLKEGERLKAIEIARSQLTEDEIELKRIREGLRGLMQQAELEKGQPLTERERARYNISHYVLDQLKQARKVGFEEAKSNVTTVIAKNVLADNIPVSSIAKYTGLTAEEVAAIRDGKPINGTDDGRS